MEEWTIRNLINELNRLTKLYDEGHPEVSDEYWDNLYFKLKQMEKETGIIYPDSPTQKIYFEKVSELKKVKHNHPMLSLDKTKDFNDIKSFVKSYKWIAMAKMDGLTCSLKYLNGELVSAETRGNGIEGEDVTHNAKVIASIPQKIDYKEELVIDGEVICTYEDFEQFKKSYKNPRNFASGSIRLLDSKECEKRKLTFVAWDCFINKDNFYNDYLNYPFKFEETLSLKLQILQDLGFIVVPNISDVEISIDKVVDFFKENCTYPIDGIVFKYDNVEDYKAAGRTDHHFKGGLAYKFYDETYSTRLKYIQWTMGRTGILTPVAVFKPINIDGTTVERASLHNVSIMREILGDCAYVGEPLEVAKMNQIIPQIVEAGPKYDYGYVISHGGVSANDTIEKCPYCSGEVEYKESAEGVINAYCTNSQCEGKLVNRLDHFCGKKGLDIKGLSKATLGKFIEWGWVENIEDLYYISEKFRSDFLVKPGFGNKSVTKILNAIEESKHTTLDAFISAIGIPLIGRAVAKDLVNYFETYEDFRNAVDDKNYHFYDLNNFGEEMDKSIKNFNYAEADKISKLLFIEAPVVNKNQINNSLTGKTIVITGKLTNFKNRAELKAIIEKYGGKVTDSISAKTDILINNDINSPSSKNETAKKRGIPIITELDFIQKYIEK